ncbi:MAG: carbohydrate binding domain-containing protein, partial [Bacteroidota bacterium]|nr:carbohydrate binding domain-containing protein [Bacteroidota bacterium]
MDFIVFMKQKLFRSLGLLFTFTLQVMVNTLQAQPPGDCVLLPPAITIDFGSGNINDVNMVRPPKYNRDFSACPNDGFYSFTSHTNDCFNGDWLTFNSDHTANGNGNMMLVNASETGGIFFNTIVDGLKPNTTYQFGAWMVNVCRINGGCTPLPPDITVRLYTTSGKEVIEFTTGQLTQNDVPRWKKYFGYFVTPADVSS